VDVTHNQYQLKKTGREFAGGVGCGRGRGKFFSAYTVLLY